LCQADTKDTATLKKIEAYLKTFPTADSFEKHITGDIAWNSVSLAWEKS